MMVEMHSKSKNLDLIVLGAGAGGLTAAAVAATEGLQVLVLEKASQVGGTTAISGGMIWAPNSHLANAPDSLEQAKTYLDAVVPTDAGQSQRRTFLERAPEMIAYLEKNTSVKLQAVPIYPDYEVDAPGASTHGRVLEPVRFDARTLGPAFSMVRPPLPEFTLFGGMMIARPDIVHFRNVFRSLRSSLRVARLIVEYIGQRLAGNRRGTTLVLGNALVARLLKSLLDRGVEIRCRCEVKNLVVTNNRVTGVRVTTEGGEQTIAARCGVVLATGGFSADIPLREAYLPPQARTLTATAGVGTGDGLRYGLAVGARITPGPFGSAYWTPASHYTDTNDRHVVFPHTVTDRAKPGLIAVNRDGRRFTNEAVSYHQFVTAMLRENNVADAVPAHLICDKRFLWKYGLGAIRPMTLRLGRYKAAGYLKEAATLHALAGTLLIDAKTFEATIDRYNDDARVGKDTEFDRGGNVYQRFMGDAENFPNPCMAPIEAPPFYSIALYPADLGTATGLDSDDDARVLDGAGQPIAGLYACGNDMNAIMQGAYPSPGTTIGPAMTYGYLAAMHAAHTDTN